MTCLRRTAADNSLSFIAGTTVVPLTYFEHCCVNLSTYSAILERPAVICRCRHLSPCSIVRPSIARARLLCRFIHSHYWKLVSPVYCSWHGVGFLCARARYHAPSPRAQSPTIHRSSSSQFQFNLDKQVIYISRLGARQWHSRVLISAKYS